VARSETAHSRVGGERVARSETGHSRVRAGGAVGDRPQQGESGWRGQETGHSEVRTGGAVGDRPQQGESGWRGWRGRRPATAGENYLVTAYADGIISLDQLTASVQGWINHVRYSNSMGLRKAVLTRTVIPKQQVTAKALAGLLTVPDRAARSGDRPQPERC
jgi:hypothetical protein